MSERSVEQQVAQHYSRGPLEEIILDTLRSIGKDVDALTTADLSGADEFHLGWRPATLELAKDLGLSPDAHVLDVGSGIGGPARTIAEACGCRVTGLDLTEDFVRTAQVLTERCGLADRTSFRQGSALAMPFADATFDAATMIHVGMNIADKAQLFAEVRRVLKPGGRFGVYDVMRASDGALPYPMPWAMTPATSFVEPAETYRRLLASAGFVVEQERDRSQFVRALWQEMRAHAAAHGPPPLPPLLMGAATAERLGNVSSALESGTIAPTEIIARAG